VLSRSGRGCSGRSCLFSGPDSSRLFVEVILEEKSCRVRPPAAGSRAHPCTNLVTGPTNQAGFGRCSSLALRGLIFEKFWPAQPTTGRRTGRGAPGATHDRTHDRTRGGGTRG